MFIGIADHVGRLFNRDDGGEAGGEYGDFDRRNPIKAARRASSQESDFHQDDATTYAPAGHRDPDARFAADWAGSAARKYRETTPLDAGAFDGEFAKLVGTVRSRNGARNGNGHASTMGRGNGNGDEGIGVGPSPVAAGEMVPLADDSSLRFLPDLEIKMATGSLQEQLQRFKQLAGEAHEQVIQIADHIAQTGEDERTALEARIAELLTETNDKARQINELERQLDELKQWIASKPASVA